MLKLLDRLEEWLIATLIAGATLLIFVAVLHRYALDLSAKFHFDRIYDTLFQINLSWAQELCIYMFVWMAKFGAAYGVRTGMHVGVDVLVNHLPPRGRFTSILVGLGAGALFTFIVGYLRRRVRLAARAHRPELAGPRGADVDRVPRDPAGLLPDVLPLPAGRLALRP